MMKYIVYVDYYNSNGYSHTETFESGDIETVFKAKDWFDSVEFDIADDRWMKITAKFYSTTEQYLEDDPFEVNEYRTDICMKDKHGNEVFHGDIITDGDAIYRISDAIGSVVEIEIDEDGRCIDVSSEHVKALEEIARCEKI